MCAKRASVVGDTELIDWLLKSVGDVADPAAVVVDAAEPVINVVARLRAAGQDAAVIVDETGAVAGVVDADDVLRRVVFEVPPEQPIETVLAGPPPLVRIEEPLYRAVGRLARERRALLVAVDAAGRPRGILRWSRAVGGAVGHLPSRLAAAASGNDVGGLAAAKAAQPEIVAELLAAQQPAVAVLRFINDVNLDLTRRVVDGAVAALAVDGWGEPPVPFAMVVMGSAGRGESLLHPDQDNGFILDEYPDAEQPRVDGWFAELARRVTRDLEAVGFPLCVGNVMASNPFWRKTLSQWCVQIDAWTRERSNLAILFADIFFDFRLARGRAELATGLRSHVTATARGNLPFLNQLVWQQSEQPAVFGMFGRLLAGQRAEHPDAIDVKLHGLLPLVELARLLSLKAGIAETPTLARLAALRSAGVIDDERHEELAEGYVFLVDLLLRRQLDDWAAGRPRGYFVAAATLPRRQREQLLETLRAIEGFRKRVVADMLGSAPVGMAG